MSFSLSFPDVNNRSRVLRKYQVIVDIKADCLVGCLSNSQNDCFNIFDFEVNSYETIVVFFVNMNHNLVAVSAGSDSDNLMQRYFSFDSVRDYRVRRCKVDDVFIGHNKGSLLSLIDMIDLYNQT